VKFSEAIKLKVINLAQAVASKYHEGSLDEDYHTSFLLKLEIVRREAKHNLRLFS
jgi:hypothetical protein